MATSSSSSSFPTSFSWRERQVLVDVCARDERVYDLCIVGGGITGAAIARDAALRGLSVLLVEKNDFGSGTSSRSSKLVHGGVRYLEQYEFKLVMEATRERARLWRLAPELVTPLAFLFPAYRGDRVPLWKLNAGLWLYDLLSLFRSPTMHKKLDARETLNVEPAMNPEGLQGSIFYWDGATDDARLTLANILDAYRAGAVPLSRVSCERIDFDARNGGSTTHPHRVQLRDELKQKTFTARARVVVSATGPWTDQFLHDLGQPARPKLATTRGSHLVVPAARLPAKHAVVLLHPRDGRVLFVIPWGESSIIGTTDLFDKDSPDSTRINREEVAYLLEAANDYFPSAQLTETDVVSVWTGLRPLLAPPESENASAISREHLIEWDDRGFALIAGGKLTTHREMADQLVDRVIDRTLRWTAPLSAAARSTTETRPLPRLGHAATRASRLGTSEASALTLADIAAICEEHCVLTLEDLLVRRTSIFYKEPDNGWGLLPKLRSTVCEALNWNAAQWERECEAYAQYLRHSHWDLLERKIPPTV